jgi:Flp pilus assembly protein TadD
MRRRDFTIGLLLAGGTRSVQAQEPAKQHRIAVIFSGPVADIRDTGSRYWPAFFEELRRRGDVEGQTLTIERYSGEGRPEGLAKLAREVTNRNPDLIVATTNPIALAVRGAVVLLERALVIDPGYAPAAAMIGWCRVLQREGLQLVSEAEATEALRLARHAIEAGKDDPDTLWMAGHVILLFGGDHAGAASAFDRALVLNPNSAHA